MKRNDATKIHEAIVARRCMVETNSMIDPGDIRLEIRRGREEVVAIVHPDTEQEFRDTLAMIREWHV